MITAKQARERSYDKVVVWCERKLQPEIEIKILIGEKRANKLFTDDEVEPNLLKELLEKYGYTVELVNMTERCGFKSEYNTIYSVTVRW